MTQNIVAAPAETFSPFGNHESIRCSAQRAALVRSRLTAHDYQLRLQALQNKLRLWHEQVQRQEHRVIVLLEGRDTAGKGGSAKRILESLDPSASRGVRFACHSCSEKTSDESFYLDRLPEPGHVVVLDGGWYSAEVLVQPNGANRRESFAARAEYLDWLEGLVANLGVRLLKYWFRSNGPTASESAVRMHDDEADDREDFIGSRWRNMFTEAEEAFLNPKAASIPWTLVETADRRAARLSCMEHLATRSL